jgi:hypothetical protein
MKIESIVSKLKSRLTHLIILISLTLEKNTILVFKISPLKYNF